MKKPIEISLNFTPIKYYFEFFWLIGTDTACEWDWAIFEFWPIFHSELPLSVCFREVNQRNSKFVQVRFEISFSKWDHGHRKIFSGSRIILKNVETRTRQKPVGQASVEHGQIVLDCSSTNRFCSCARFHLFCVDLRSR